MGTFSLGSRARSAGYGLVAFERVGSTNAEALALARRGERGPLWCVTDEQTSGRGRRQRPWAAPRGNLAASVMEISDIAPATAATLGFVAGLALDRALRDAATSLKINAPDELFRLKWPNDMLAGGAKLAGILLEAEQVGHGELAVVVGIGVNVVAAPRDLPYRAASLGELGLLIGAADLFSSLSDAWVEFVHIWNRGKGIGTIREMWLKRAAGLGQKVSVDLGARRIEGLFETIDADGRLILVAEDGSRVPVSAGEVQFGKTDKAGAD